jgi:hypothetical protein
VGSLAVLVVEEGVAAAEVGQAVDPLPLRGGDQGEPPGIARVGRLAGLIRFAGSG